MHCSSKHIHINLLGGFGNQLFQLANAVSLSIEYQRPFQLVPPSHGRPFSIGDLGLQPFVWYQARISDSNLQMIRIDTKCRSWRKSFVKEKSFNYSKCELPNECSQVTGYFQSYKYFSLIGDAFRTWMIARLGVTPGIRSSLEIGLHLRLGDMANDPKSRAYHGIISEDYIDQSLKFFQCSYTDLRLITESIDDAFREYPKLMSNEITRVGGVSALDDFMKIIEFQNLTISNSSFSWWGAYIAKSVTVAPKDWFAPSVLAHNSVSDLFLPQWIIL